MEIAISHAQGRVPVTVLHIKGPVTDMQPLVTGAREAVEAGARDILLDLAEVPYMSSQGLRALHQIFMLLRSAETGESDDAISRRIAAGTFVSPHLKLLRPAKYVLQVLKLAGFDMFLEIHDDLDKAVASF